MLSLMTSALGLLKASGLDSVAKVVEIGKDKALDYIKDKTGIDLTSSDTKELTFEQIETLRNLDLKQMELEIENTKDARNMQVEALKQEDLFSKRFIYYLALVWSIFTMVYIPCITFLNVPNERFADTVLGFVLGTVIANILNFFFGSSHSSFSKNETIKNMSNKK